MSAIVLRGDARNLPLPDESVDLIVTSPPYWALRDYRDQGESLEGQIGNEPAWQEYLANLLECTREWVRVVKPSGSIFVVIGDKYSDRGHGPSRGQGTGRGPQSTALRQTRGPLEKSLIGLPWRYALACVDDLGLTLRQDCIDSEDGGAYVWQKANGLPESVTDRCRRAHEYIFHLVKQPRYFSALDEIREEFAPETGKRYAAGYNPRKVDGKQPGIGIKLGGDTYGENALGKLPGSVWEIPSAPLFVPEHIEHGCCCGGRKRPGCEDGLYHHAAFPPALVKKIILGWCPSGICTECGEGRFPVTDSRRAPDRPGRVQHREGDSLTLAHGGDGRAGSRHSTVAAITGYACGCPVPDAPTRPALVADPFGGTGTTAMVADVLGRTGISIDRSHDYGLLAQWRTTDPAERARALGVPKPPPVPQGQMDLFGGEAS